jgi:CO dehydrogenase maturation factor
MKTIAISGKGGTGKTTISALMVRWLSDHVSRSILVVDADSNVNLNELLGVPLGETIGSIREEMKSKVSSLPGGMTKQQFLEYKIQSSLIETPNFDLIAMGCPEGPGCYCYANNLLRDILRTLAVRYDFVLIDNEAGMEHLSRRTTQNIDYLFMVSEPTIRAVHAAGKISRLVKDLDTRVKEKYLILNKVSDSVSQTVIEKIESEGLRLLYSIPLDDELLNLDYNGKSIWSILSELNSYKEIDKLMKKLGFN